MFLLICYVCTSFANKNYSLPNQYKRDYKYMGQTPFNPDNYARYLCKLQYCHDPKTMQRCTMLIDSNHKKNNSSNATSIINWTKIQYRKLFSRNNNPSILQNEPIERPFYFIDWIQRNKAEKDFHTFSRKDNTNVNYIINAFTKNITFHNWCQQKHCNPASLKITHHDWSRLGKELQLNVSFNDGSQRLLEVVCLPTRTSKQHNLTNQNK